MFVFIGKMLSPCDKRKVEVDYVVKPAAKNAGLLTALELKGPGRAFVAASYKPGKSLAGHYNEVFKNPRFLVNGDLEESWFHYMLAQILIKRWRRRQDAGASAHTTALCVLRLSQVRKTRDVPGFCFRSYERGQ